MDIKNETLPHAGGFIVSELGTFSRDKIVIQAGQILQAGTVLGKLTGSNAGDYTRLDPGASDGSEAAAAILYADVDATAGDTDATGFLRGPAEVHDGRLVFASSVTVPQRAAAIAELAALDIIAR